MQEMKNIEEGSSQRKPVAQADNNTAIPTPRLMQNVHKRYSEFVWGAKNNITTFCIKYEQNNGCNNEFGPQLSNTPRITVPLLPSYRASSGSA